MVTKMCTAVTKRYTAVAKMCTTANWRSLTFTGCAAFTWRHATLARRQA